MLSCMNIICNNIDCLNDRFTYFYLTRPIKGYNVRWFQWYFFIYYFSLFVPIFDLVHALNAILIPLKQQRASQNRLRNVSDDRENAIFSSICIYLSIYLIFLKKKIKCC